MASGSFTAGPENGGQSKSEAPPRPTGIRKLIPHYKESGRAMVTKGIIVPIMMIGFNGYMLYGFCYIILWRRVQVHHHGAAIAILVLFCFLDFCALFSLCSVYIWGPGYITEEYISKTDDNDAFLCDFQGYSLFCSHCKKLKPNWAHHCGQSGRCVPKLDHFCPMVYAWIGQGNMKFFLQFLWSAFMLLTLVLVTLFIYQHDRHPYINGNAIALYIAVPPMLFYLASITSQYVLYIALCHTLIESLGVRHGNLPHVNIPYKGERRVVHPLKRDVFIPHHGMFSHGVWNNITDVLGPVYTWFLPIRPPLYEPQFNQDFVRRMQERVDSELQDTTDIASIETTAEKVAVACIERRSCSFYN